jgi:cytochrome c biogenesis protein CcdA
MELGIASYGLGYAAGVVSTLSPCVLPLLPIVLGAAVAAHRWGAAALAAGLMLSFTSAGLFVAALGPSLGIDDALLRTLSAALLAAAGATMAIPALQAGFARLTTRLSGSGEALLARWDLGGLRGQFLVGLMLGLVWSPCAGPTLGGAVALAAQGHDLARSAVLMALFGLGATTPLLALGLLSHGTAVRLRGPLARAGNAGKTAMGLAMLLMGLLTLTGADHAIQAWAVDRLPAWLTDLTTRW